MSVTAPAGFVAGGLASGIKASGAPDLALVATADARPVPAAGVFTTNLAGAAPVHVSRAHLADGHASAVVLNSGNANAATGDAGRRDARRTCELVAERLGAAATDVLVCSTGLIGFPLPMASVEAGIPRLVGGLGATPAHATAAAEAILTTDTVRKEALADAALGSGVATVGGMAKGAAMLSPAMATMLALLTTDATVKPPVLQRALASAVAETFDRLSVDGCRSTNDTVLVLASGRAGLPIVDTNRGAGFHALTDALTTVCGSLAEQMAADAEGATKLARIRVVGAASDGEAVLAARTVANSQLVQCSLNGEDPYWGRVLSELGASGAHFDPERVEIAYGEVTVCRDGVAAPHDAAAVAAVMARRDLTITCRLDAGHGEATILTTDLSHAYLDENRTTS